MVGDLLNHSPSLLTTYSQLVVGFVPKPLIQCVGGGIDLSFLLAGTAAFTHIDV